jgi:AcrR family transcriptional regulator
MRARPDDTRARLIQAAGEAFAEKGYEAASVREICKLADANLAAINYHFGDKERLYAEVVRTAACASPAEQALSWPDGTPAATKLRDIIRERVSATLHTDRPSWSNVVMLREMARPSLATVAFVEEYVRNRYQQLEGILAEILPRETTAADLHLAGFSIISQCLHFRVHAAITRMLVGDEEYGTYTADRLADHISRFSLAALGLGQFLPPGEESKRKSSNGRKSRDLLQGGPS